jgi:dTDP-4-amino-4,6-dideoxygalactose transaminase
MTQPRIPLAVPDLRGREAELLAKCVAENWVSSAGPEVSAFERGIAEVAGRAHAVATVNGTAALHLALMALGIGRGDRVVVPDWTFAASANAVAHAGATPVFVDVREQDWALDPDLTAEVLAADPSIRAVIAVDPVGHLADMDALGSVCAARGVALVEDAAGGIGASYRGRPCGSFGLISTFSFNGNKTVTAGGGGMVLTDDEAIARLVRHRSTQARAGLDYSHDMVGYNYRMTNLNAAVGLAQLERLDEMVAAKRAIAARYDEGFAGLDGVAPMPRPAWCDSTGWLYCVRLSDEAEARALVAALDRAGADARLFWRSLSVQAPWRDAPRRLTGVSEGLTGRVVSLPCSSFLTGDEQDRVIEAVRRWRLAGAAAA